MALFEVTLKSLSIVAAGEDGPDGDAEWLLDFFADPIGQQPPTGNFARFQDPSVHTNNTFTPNISFFVDTGPAQPNQIDEGLSLRVIGREIDSLQNGEDGTDDPLPDIRFDIGKGGNTTFVADVTTTAQTGTQGPQEGIFRYDVVWHIETRGLAVPGTDGGLTVFGTDDFSAVGDTGINGAAIGQASPDLPSASDFIFS